MVNGSWFMVKGYLRLMVHGSRFIYDSRLMAIYGSWFMINGQLMVQDSWLKINELLDGREEKLF